MDDIADSFEETVKKKHDKGTDGGSKGRGGGRRTGRGRGGGGGRGASREVMLSKALSKLLRHQAASAGIQLDREGYAALDKVLQYGPIKSLRPTFPEIVSAVRDSDKQRFALKPKDPAKGKGGEGGLDDYLLSSSSSADPAEWLIRANQGHSIKVDSEALLRPIAVSSSIPPSSDRVAVNGGEGGGGNAAAVAEGSAGGLLAPVPVPETVVHGTYFAFWPAIAASGGLRRMGRNHVHCSTGLPEDGGGGGGEGEGEARAVISGMRRDAELLVYVDVERSIREAGMRWWVSENGVVLTEGLDEGGQEGLVPSRFFKLVVGRRKDVGVLWRDGEKVADLPEGLKVVVPAGKGPRGGRGRGGRGGGMQV